MDSQVVGNVSSTFSWVPNPTTRGTSNILVECIVTIGLCVWSAVHLNIPEDKQSTFCWIDYQTWRKLGWIMIGLFAPELLIYTAWCQRSQALWFMHAYNRAFSFASPESSFERLKRFFTGEFRATGYLQQRKGDLEATELSQSTNSSARKPKEPWTLQHGFYAQMGGFALDTIASTTAKRYSLPQTRVRLNIDQFVGFLGFYSLNTKRIETEEELFLDVGVCNLDPKRPPRSIEQLHITAAEIADKSTANGLAKGLVCMQSVWFCIQCMARLAQNLPLSLLEINTAAHALAAVTTYIIWWHKPLDVQRPTSVFIESEGDARRWVSAFQKGGVCFGCLQGKAAKQPDLHHQLRGFKLQIDPGHEGEIQKSNAVLSSPSVTTPGFFMRLASDRGRGLWWPASTSTTPNGIPGWKDQVWRAVERDDGWGLRASGYCYCHSTARRSALRAGSFPGLFRFPLTVIIFGLALLTVYGGLHLLAWNSQFPSDAQQLLWRISACIVTGGWPCGLVLFLSTIKTWEKRDQWSSLFWIIPLEINAWMSPTLLILGVLAYVAARIYLVVDCFIQLFHLEPGAFFEQPRWLAYVPHLG